MPVLPALCLVLAARAEVVEEALPNGLRVVVEADPRAPLVALHLRLPAGAADDPPERPGLAHLVEHLVFAGTPGFPDGLADRLVERAGGWTDGWVGRDWTDFEVLLPAAGLELGLAIEADVLRGLAVDAEDLAAQLAVLEREREEGGEGTAEAVDRAAFGPRHPYGRALDGPPAKLAGVRLEEVRAFHAARYRPGGAVLAVVGDVDPDAAIAAARAVFGALPAGGGERPGAGADGEPPPGGVAGAPPGGQALVAAWRTVPRGHPDEPALDVLSGILEARLGAGAVAWTRNQRLGGVLVVEVEAGPPRRAWRRVRRAVRRLARRGPRRAELEAVRGEWRDWALRAERASPPERADVLAGCASELGVADCVDEELARRLEVDAADVRRAAARWLDAERAVRLVAGEGR